MQYRNAVELEKGERWRGSGQVLPNPQVRLDEEMCLVARGVLWGHEANLR